MWYPMTKIIEDKVPTACRHTYVYKWNFNIIEGFQKLLQVNTTLLLEHHYRRCVVTWQPACPAEPQPRMSAPEICAAINRHRASTFGRSTICNGAARIFLTCSYFLFVSTTAGQSALPLKDLFKRLHSLTFVDRNPVGFLSLLSSPG